MTALTDAGSSNVRNAKQRERPAASRMIVHASTLPNCEKYFLNDSATTTRFSTTPRGKTGHCKVCTICRVPVQAADEHFPASIESIDVLMQARGTKRGVNGVDKGVHGKQALLLASNT